MRKLLKAHGHTPRVMITDKLRSYYAAKRVRSRQTGKELRNLAAPQTLANNHSPFPIDSST